MAESPLHIVVFPWQAFGHMIPYLELSRSLAARGHRVSYLSAPRNIQRLPTHSAHPLIRFVPIPFSSSSASLLPPGAESTADLPSADAPDLLLAAVDSLRDAVADFLSSADPKPDWIIHDFAPYWLPALAADFGIPCALFNTFPSFFVAFTAPYLYGPPPPQKQPQELPASLVFRPYQIRQLMGAAQRSTAAVNVAERWRTARAQAEFMAIRDCDELDADWLAILHGFFDKPVVPVGLLPPARNAGADSDPHSSSIVRWLDGQPPSSAVYVSLGTEATLDADLLRELALGLELSGAPFVWALRAPAELLLPEGFVARMGDSGRGVVATGWVPQLEILGHRAVGVFVTHCGWSSIIEGLGFGRPLVMLPVLHDQGVNAQAVAAKKVGVEIERDLEDGSFTKESVARAVRLVLAEEAGEEIRANAKKMEGICGNRDCNERYVDRLVQLLRDHHSPPAAAAAAACK
uniref:Glycosyltransferase n=1 Tax=Ananas comosus var. bracteatus TaxID=296719 RepID=A0A6V7NH51_ANACO|nr:unnamed protein product [Ananas comosus var. bracteatus]